MKPIDVAAVYGDPHAPYTAAVTGLACSRDPEHDATTGVWLPDGDGWLCLDCAAEG